MQLHALVHSLRPTTINNVGNVWKNYSLEKMLEKQKGTTKEKRKNKQLMRNMRQNWQPI